MMTQQEVQEKLKFAENDRRSIYPFLARTLRNCCYSNVSDEVKTVSLGESGTWSIVVKVKRQE